MKLTPMQGQVLDGMPLIQAGCRDARGPPCPGRPDMIGNAIAIAGVPGRHGRSEPVSPVGFGVGNGSGPRCCGSPRGSEARAPHRGVFVHRHDPRCGTERISFCQGAHGALENHPVGIQAVGRGAVAHGLTTPSSCAMGRRCTMATTMLVKAGERLPVKRHHHGS